MSQEAEKKLEDCSICLEPYKEKVLLKCKHSYCKDCITRWFKTSVCPTCPNCKGTFVLRDLAQYNDRKPLYVYENFYHLTGDKENLLKKLQKASLNNENFVLTISEHLQELENLTTYIGYLRSNLIINDDETYQINGPIIVKANQLLNKLIADARHLRNVKDSAQNEFQEITSNCDCILLPNEVGKGIGIEKLTHTIDKFSEEQENEMKAIDVKYKRGKYKSDRYFKLFAYIIKEAVFNFGTCPKLYTGGSLDAWFDKFEEFISTINNPSDHIVVELLKSLLPEECCFWNADSVKQGISKLRHEIQSLKV